MTKNFANRKFMRSITQTSLKPISACQNIAPCVSKNIFVLESQKWSLIRKKYILQFEFVSERKFLSEVNPPLTRLLLIKINIFN